MALQWVLGWMGAAIAGFAPLIRETVVEGGLRTTEHISLWTDDPENTALLLLPSVVAVAIGFLFRAYRIARALAVLVLWWTVIAGSLLVGPFFLPSALVATLALFLPNPQPRTQKGRSS